MDAVESSVPLEAWSESGDTGYESDEQLSFLLKLRVPLQGGLQPMMRQEHKILPVHSMWRSPIAWSAESEYFSWQMEEQQMQWPTLKNIELLVSHNCPKRKSNETFAGAVQPGEKNKNFTQNYREYSLTL